MEELRCEAFPTESEWLPPESNKIFLSFTPFFSGRNDSRRPSFTPPNTLRIPRRDWSRPLVVCSISYEYKNGASSR